MGFCPFVDGRGASTFQPEYPDIFSYQGTARSHSWVEASGSQSHNKRWDQSSGIISDGVLSFCRQQGYISPVAIGHEYGV